MIPVCNILNLNYVGTKKKVDRIRNFLITLRSEYNVNNEDDEETEYGSDEWSDVEVEIEEDGVNRSLENVMYAESSR